MILSTLLYLLLNPSPVVCLSVRGNKCRSQIRNQHRERRIPPRKDWRVDRMSRTTRCDGTISTITSSRISLVTSSRPSNWSIEGNTSFSIPYKVTVEALTVLWKLNRLCRWKCAGINYKSTISRPWNLRSLDVKARSTCLDHLCTFQSLLSLELYAVGSSVRINWCEFAVIRF